MDIGNSTGIDESHRQIFWGGGPHKDFASLKNCLYPNKNILHHPIPPPKKRLQTGSLPEKATP